MEAGTFDSLIPSRYISFILPIQSLSCPIDYTVSNYLQISVLDSPFNPTTSPKIAAMIVPKHRENDWVFTTESGHHQLLSNSPGISRLILIGNAPNCDVNVGNLYKRSLENCLNYRVKLEESLYPLLMALLPKEIAQSGNFEVPFLSYEDNLISSVILECCVGDCVGEMLVEDVEIEGSKREFRRRLRFKRMPNLIQTQINLVPNGFDDDSLDSMCFKEGGLEEGIFSLDVRSLVHPYLEPMVASLCLIGGYIEECYESNARPRGLCIGVGGGALLSFLSLQLGFEVVGIEIDEAVLRIAKQYFGLQTSSSMHLFVGDGIEILKKVAFLSNNDNAKDLIPRDRSQLHEPIYQSQKIGVKYNNKAFLNNGSKSSSLVDSTTRKDYCKEYIENFGSKFHVIMLDVDSSDVKMEISAPTLDFVQKDVLLAAKSSLLNHGILVLNVIPSDKSFYDMLIHKLKEVFVDLYEIDCGNEENFVLIASKTSVAVTENKFLRKLNSVISGAFVDSVRKI
ncbi:unnamed protein product [Amaranthus hypochondriacus]